MRTRNGNYRCSFWKQSSRGVLRKRCSENILCNFIEIALPHGCSPVNLQVASLKSHFGMGVLL